MPRTVNLSGITVKVPLPFEELWRFPVSGRAVIFVNMDVNLYLFEASDRKLDEVRTRPSHSAQQRISRAIASRYFCERMNAINGLSSQAIGLNKNDSLPRTVLYQIPMKIGSGFVIELRPKEKTKGIDSLRHAAPMRYMRLSGLENECEEKSESLSLAEARPLDTVYPSILNRRCF